MKASTGNNNYMCGDPLENANSSRITKILKHIQKYEFYYIYYLFTTY